MMKNITFILIMFFSVSTSYSQNCKEHFTNNLEKTYYKRKRKFEKEIKRSINKYNKINITSLINYNVILIPDITGKKRKQTEVNKENFFCHLNYKSMELDEAIIYNSDSTLGVITLCPGNNCRIQFIDSKNEFFLFKKPIIKNLLNIKPDIVFTVYNISCAYWFVKDDEIKVLSYENLNGKLKNLKIYKAKEYIETLTKDQIEAFMFFKKVKVICY